MAVDWLKIKTEYVNGGISYRELSERYGVSQSTIRKRAAVENWTSAKEAQRNKIGTRTEQKIVEKAAEALSDETLTKVRMRVMMFRMIEAWLSGQEELGITDTSAFRRIVQCCVDLGVMDKVEVEAIDNDGLLEALAANAEQLFDDGDDSGSLPIED